MTMDAGADVQQGSETAVSETDTQQIATLAQVRRTLRPLGAVGREELDRAPSAPTSSGVIFRSERPGQ